MTREVANQPVNNQPEYGSETLTEDARFKRRSRLMGLLVIGIIVLPMVAAFIIYQTGVGIPTGTVNKGELLLPPQAISPLSLKDTSGQALDILKGEKKWRLLIPASGDCDSACQQSLYVTRQVHIRLGEKAVRVERYYLHVQPQRLDTALTRETEAYLTKEHPRLQVAVVKKNDLAAFLAPTNTADDPITAGRYFLMDQEGFVMMSYTPEHSGNQLLGDLKRLLKYSYDG